MEPSGTGPTTYSNHANQLTKEYNHDYQDRQQQRNLLQGSQDPEWATRLKYVELADEVSVTVIDDFKDDLFHIHDSGNTAMQLKTDCTVVIVFADDTISIYASTDVVEAVEFANDMIELLEK